MSDDTLLTLFLIVVTVGGLWSFVSGVQRYRSLQPSVKVLVAFLFPPIAIASWLFTTAKPQPKRQPHDYWYEPKGHNPGTSSNSRTGSVDPK